MNNTAVSFLKRNTLTIILLVGSIILYLLIPSQIAENMVSKAAISAACKEALEDPEVIEAIANIGLEPDYRDSTAYAEGLSELVPVAKTMLVELGFLAG